MARIVESAKELKFEEHELVEFFEDEGIFDEDGCSITYSKSKDGMKLEVTIFPIDGGVYTDLYKDGIEDPVFESKLEGCTKCRFFAYKKLRMLEFGQPEIATTEKTVPLAWGIRIALYPHIHLEYVQEG